MVVPLDTVTPVVRSALPLGVGGESGVALSVGAGDPVTGAVWGAVVPVLGLDEPVAAGEPPVRPSRATAPQATSGTMMSTAASGIQLRHAGT